MSYSEDLKNPKWQRLRLEIMQRDSWKCLWCDAHDKTLNVHHGYYASGIKPWEYDTETLWTLCEDCHKKAEEDRRFIKFAIGKIHPARLRCLARWLSMDIRGLNGNSAGDGDISRSNIDTKYNPIGRFVASAIRSDFIGKGYVDVAAVEKLDAEKCICRLMSAVARYRHTEGDGI